MYLKDPTKVKLRFTLIEPVSGKDVILAENTIAALCQSVRQQLAEFDKVTEGRYTEKAREEASDLKLQWPAYINKVVQHQICINLSEPSRYCWNDGYGDKLHALSRGIDQFVDKMPTPLRALARAGAYIATKVATGKGKTKLGGCSTCGGAKKFSSDTKRQLGRAGKLNNL